MIRSTKQQQQIFIGVAVAATAVVSITLLAWHLSTLKQKSLSKQKQHDDEENDDDVDDISTTKGRTLTPKKGSKSSSVTVNSKGIEIDTDPTPRRTNLTGSTTSIGTGISSNNSTATTAASSTTISADEKLIHTKIEDLDKLGKAYFKDKKVNRQKKKQQIFSLFGIIKGSFRGICWISLSFSFVLLYLCSVLFLCNDPL
jgi:hypothetical protein